MQRLGDQRFVGVRPVTLGGIEELDAELRGAPQHSDRVPAVPRLAPDILIVDHPHGTETKAVDGHVGEADGAQAEVRPSCLEAARAEFQSLLVDHQSSQSLSFSFFGR